MEPRVTDSSRSIPTPHAGRWPSSAFRTSALCLAACASSALLLVRFPPEAYPFYPPCPIHRLTGLLCPGCGATRALAALLNGHLRQALDHNALVVLALPLLAIWLAVSWKQRRWLPLPTSAIALLFLVTTVFTVSRNLHSF